MGPITGPFEEVVNVIGRYYSRTVWKQKPPYNLRLPYRACLTTSNNPYHTPAAYGFNPEPNELDLVRNKCYDRFMGKLRNLSTSPAGWGMTLASHQQAREMFNKRGANLLEYITKLERNFRSTRKRRTTKEWSSFFLEYRFGWEPILKDIHASMEIIASQPKTGLVSSSARGFYEIKPKRDPSDFDTLISVKGQIRYRMMADVVISNPNVYLLNTLGLVNPAVIAFDRVPWLFVLDWWTNFAQVASSFTDFYGLSISNGTTTEKISNKGTYGYFRSGGKPVLDQYGYQTEQILRKLGTPSPRFAIRPFEGLSMVRGATAIALTLQLLTPEVTPGSLKRGRFYKWEPIVKNDNPFLKLRRRKG